MEIGLLIGLLLLLGLAIFIVWDGRQLRKPSLDTLPADIHQKGFVPGVLGVWKLLAGMASVSFILAVHDYYEPSSPPFVGRGAFLRELVYSVFGPSGLIGLSILFGLLLLYFAYWARRAERKRRDGS